MRKIIPLLLAALALVLAACQPQSAPPDTAMPATTEASSEPTDAPLASPTIEQPTAMPDPAQTAMVGPQAPPGCTVVSQADASSSDSPFPEISADDWVQGPEDAYVSIIEYGDFQ